MTMPNLAEYVAQSGDPALIAEFAEMSRTQISEAEAASLQQRRERAIAGLSKDPELRAQIAEMRSLRDELRDFRQSVERQAAAITRLEQDGPARIGKTVGAAVNKSAAEGKRRDAREHG